MSRTSYDSVRDWRHNNKLKLFQAFSSKCGCCGLVDHPIVYDLHHIDPTQKEFTITSQIRSWKNVVAEAKKCRMLCAPCHRKFHAGVLALPDEMPIFDESLIEVVTTEDECPVCSGRKPISQITCSTACARRHRHKIDWDKLDLRSLLKEHGSAYAIARAIGGISDVSVRKRLRAAGLQK